jgi:putative membrane protein
MVRDHTKANNDLKDLARDKKLAIPTSMNNDHQSMVDDLRKRTKADFDRSYMDMMVTDHLEDIEAFRNAGKESDDTDIRAFAIKTLPVLQAHLDSARMISSAISKR